MTEQELDTLFAAGRGAAPMPSEALLSRVLDDAMTEAAKPAPAPRRRRFGAPAGLFAALGGWPALGGLAAAGVVGIWIGYAAPGGVDTLRAAMLGTGYGPADMVPSLDGYLTEG